MDASDHRMQASRPLLLRLLQLVPDQPEEFRAVVESVVSLADPRVWNDLIASASYHGVLSVVDWGLVPELQVPPDIRSEAERRLAVQEIWHAHLMRELESAVTALATEGMDVCAVKGPVLAERFYPTPAARHCLDLDLLVRPDDFDRAAVVLARSGYQTGDAESNVYLREFGHHLDFSRPGRAPIELHFRAYAGFGVDVPARALLDRASRFRLSDQASVLIPSAEDEFVYLATHAAGHSFIRLVWLYDLKLLLRHQPRINWDDVAARARALGVLSPVRYALRLLRDWIAVPLQGLPADLVHRTTRSRFADRLLAEVSRPQPKSLRDNLGGLLFTSLLCDRLGSGAWLLQHHILRAARRRLHQAAPDLLPARWAG